LGFVFHTNKHTDILQEEGINVNTQFLGHYIFRRNPIEKIPVADWMRVYEIFANLNLSAICRSQELAKNVSVSMPTAWLMIHKIRKAMTDSEAGLPLRKIVEIVFRFTRMKRSSLFTELVHACVSTTTITYLALIAKLN
jgi:hypothetical protein